MTQFPGLVSHISTDAARPAQWEKGMLWLWPKNWRDQWKTHTEPLGHHSSSLGRGKEHKESAVCKVHLLPWDTEKLFPHWGWTWIWADPALPVAVSSSWAGVWCEGSWRRQLHFSLPAIPPPCWAGVCATPTSNHSLPGCLAFCLLLHFKPSFHVGSILFTKKKIERGKKKESPCLFWMWCQWNECSSSHCSYCRNRKFSQSHLGWGHKTYCTMSLELHPPANTLLVAEGPHHSWARLGILLLRFCGLLPSLQTIVLGSAVQIIIKCEIRRL